MTSISGGHHGGRERAEIHSVSGFNSRSWRSCLAQSGSPANSNVALSIPIRRERPPTKRTAVRVFFIPTGRGFKLLFHGNRVWRPRNQVFHHSESRRVIRRALAKIPLFPAQTPDPSSNTACIPQCRESEYLG